MDKLKLEFYTFKTPRGFSVMILPIENLFKLVQGLQNEATLRN